MGMLLYFGLWCIFAELTMAVQTFEVKVLLDKAVAVTSDKFVSVTLDTGMFVNHWATFDPSKPEAVTLARGLYPAYLRVGGTTADSLIFVRNRSDVDRLPNTTITTEDWDKLNTFTIQSNLSLIFGLNSLYRSGVAWDPDNAKALMQYSADKGYALDLELGNEPDLYPSPVFDKPVDPQQLGRDFGTLRSLMDSMPTFKSRLLFGPDVANDVGTESRAYLENFMKTGSEFINAMTVHHYYVNGRDAKPENFIDSTILDSLMNSVSIARKIVGNFSQGTKEFWLGETSSAYNGGAPGLSDTFLAGFMWLDKLGIASLYGARVVVRQQFIGLNYGLIRYENGVFSANPDYWLTVLYKRLVGETVLSTGEIGGKLRVYSHCSSRTAGYPDGAVTFYMMNLYNTSVHVNFSQFADNELHLYILSSGNDNTLITRDVRLNGNLIQLIAGQLPPLNPVVQRSTAVLIQPFTLGFVVVPGASASQCIL